MKLTGIHQHWGAHITCIRLKAEFFHLAMICDGFSRKALGWALDRTLTIPLTTEALQSAIDRLQPESGLVHYSDRVLQFAFADYAGVPGSWVHGLTRTALH